jgi:acyl-CoA synthetase (AMP-forming)/AMP-acid ligase II
MGVETITNVSEVIRYHARTKPEQVALYFQGRETYYGELNTNASKVANGLIAEGLNNQSRVAVLDKNSDYFFEVFFGCSKANSVIVPVNFRLAPPEVAYIVNDAKSEVLFVGQDFLPVVEKIAGDLKTVKKIITLSGNHENWESYTAWRDRQNSDEVVTEQKSSDVAMQLYTSGTTGHPKGVQLTQDNFFALVIPFTFEVLGFTENDINMICMPLFHIGGLGWAFVGLIAGVKNVVAKEIIPPDLLKLMVEQKVSVGFFVPAVILFMLQVPGVQEMDFSNLRLMVYGASPIPLDLLKKAMAVFKCQFMQVYGLTETTGVVTVLPPEDHSIEGNKRMRSCGKPTRVNEIRIIGGDGNVVPVGQVGEIIIKSPQVMLGYWNLPKETSSSLRDGWFHTGDAGYYDEDGYLYIYDRVKDMIVSGGENIYPAEVESALFGHPAIADVAVIGVPDETWGESVKAVIVKKPGAEVTQDEIISFARERIGGYKVPRSIDFVENLPRNPSGKILKREIRAPYWANRDRQVN